MKSFAFNFRIALSALLCSVALAATAASAQEAARTWSQYVTFEGNFNLYRAA